MKTFIDLTKKIYHKVDIEIQYLMYTLNDSWKAEQISANGTPNSAEMIHDYLIESIEKIRENGVDSVYIVHNHPNTNPKPSFMDYYNYHERQGRSPTLPRAQAVVDPGALRPNR